MTTEMERSARPFDDVSLLERLRATPELFTCLRAAQGAPLAIQTQLRREFPAELVRAALLLTDLRQRAASRFSRAEHMWFDREGLEQATSETVARHKARRFQNSEEPVWDLCCGIGADAMALGQWAPVVAIDCRPAACLLTAWNAEVYGVEDRVTTDQADAESIPLAKRHMHIDPDRRPQGRRSLRIEEHRPALEFLQQATQTAGGGAIKLSPASNFGGKFTGCEIELISVHGECKEAVVWFGDLRTSTDWRATVFPSGETLIGDPWSARAVVSPLSSYLIDPDPAVVRAGLVDVLAESLGLSRLDAAEEYLTGAAAPESPFVQSFEVLADLSNNDREIRSWFRASDCGQLEIKCRRIPISVEKLRQRIPRPGRSLLTLIFARIEGRARAIVCRRIAKDPVMRGS